jgi:hypothetical protein
MGLAGSIKFQKKNHMKFSQDLKNPKQLKMIARQKDRGFGWKIRGF